MRRVLVGALLGALCVSAVGACSNSEKKKKPQGNDASTGDGSAGASGTGGSAGTGGTGGTAGTGGAGGMDASAGAGGMDAGLVCSPMLDLDGGVDGSAADASALDGGAADGSAADASALDGGAADGSAADSGDGGGTVYKWRDWANNACRDCPATTVGCTDFEGASTFDPATRILTLELAPGTADIISGTVGLLWQGPLADGGSITSSFTNAVPFTVDKNTLTADFSAEVPANFTSISSIGMELHDACGATDYPPLMHAVMPEAGTVLPVYCEF